MPVLKYVAGHTGTAAIVAYLTKDDRALAWAVNNLGESAGLEQVAQRMDATRQAYGNDGHLNRRGKPNLRYNHYVISPDPIDSPTPDEVLEFAQAWVRRYFSHYESLVVVHDDGQAAAGRGERGPVHAHVVINNTDLVDGSTLAGYLSPAMEAKVFDGLQRMAQARGWHRFEAVRHDAASEAEAVDADERGELKVSRRRAERGRGDAADEDLTAPEAGLARRGEPTWKDDLRSRVAVAAALADGLADFVGELGRLGVAVTKAEVTSAYSAEAQAFAAAGIRVVEGKRGRGMLFASMANPERLRVYGSTMGARYTMAAIAEQLRGGLPGVTLEVRRAVETLVRDVCGTPCEKAGDAASALGTVEGAYAYSSGVRIPASRIRDALDAIQDSGAASLGELERYDADAATVAEMIGYRFSTVVACSGSGAGVSGREDGGRAGVARGSEHGERAGGTRGVVRGRSATVGASGRSAGVGGRGNSNGLASKAARGAAVSGGRTSRNGAVRDGGRSGSTGGSRIGSPATSRKLPKGGRER